jgi:hypothetical protein
MTDNWPRAELDTVRRLRVLAAAIPGAAVTERVIGAPVERVWDLLSDLEGGFGEIQPDLRSLRVVRRDPVGDAERVTALARSKYGLRARLDGVVGPGWCWLQSRFLIVAMAATPEPGGGTRVALTGGVRVPGRAALIPVGVRREARRSLDRLSVKLTAAEK